MRSKSLSSSTSLLLLLSFAVLAGCPSKQSAVTTTMDAAAPVVVVVVSAPTASSAAPTEAPATPGAPPFVKVAPLASGPIVVTGYPHTIRNGMNDPADIGGFSKDGSIFGYCANGGGIESTHCEFVDRAGKITKMNSTEGEETPQEKAKKKAIDDFVKANDFAKINLDAADFTKVHGPALAGTWMFTDITIDVARVEAMDPNGTKGTTKSSPAHVKVGGLVKGEAAGSGAVSAIVHPITLVSPNAEKVPPNFAVMNVFATSPASSASGEIGMVATFFGGEFSDVFAMKRLTHGALASLIYNDTGFLKHHQQGDFAKSAVLFEKAVAADPSAKTPAYNLACAWARIKEPRAKDALAFAITRDASVKTRARTDKDFEGVKSEAWFVEATK